ncbi:MAG: carboxypeptidase regulatory-like domain-containing protein [Chloroflexota bacterium]|nr:carboxypeptidase regulatory-like domain-containing protein [Chloroflexota bacterium]
MSTHQSFRSEEAKKARFTVLGTALLMILMVVGLSACSADGQAIWNIVDYRVRKAFPPLLVPGSDDPAHRGSLTGTIRDEQGKPVSDAVALVATARGQSFDARSDSQGRFHITGIPPGRYVPVATAWQYEQQTANPVRIRAGQPTTVDFRLAEAVPEPLTPLNLQLGPAQLASSRFPQPSLASRIPFTFTLDGATIDGGLIYLPADPPDGPLPTLAMIYPSEPINWDPASVALTSAGYALLAVGPDKDRGLDIEAHVRDFRAALELWQAGQLSPLGQPADDWILISGSFGSLILYRALRDIEPHQAPAAVINIGGISDAFLGVQSLYSVNQELTIPPPYDLAVAAMGRTDRDPAFFLRLSPVHFANYLPPTLVIHTYNDEIIPFNQASAMDSALADAGIPHELLLYEDTTHYLDARYPTESTYMVFDRVLEFVETTLEPAQ